MGLSPVQRANARSQSAAIQPAPAFQLPPLPDKISRIDPEGAKQWIDGVNEAIANWVSQTNSANAANLSTTSP